MRIQTHTATVPSVSAFLAFSITQPTIMNRLLLLSAALLGATTVLANDYTISSPDGRLSVSVNDNAGQAHYIVSYDGRKILNDSRLGLQTNYANFADSLTLKGTTTATIDRTYDMTRTKTSRVHYQANQATLTFMTPRGLEMQVTFNVSNNDIAFRYTLPRPKNEEPKSAIIYTELTSFNLPDATTTFLSPQCPPMIGWENSKPSYEEEYHPDAPLTAPSQYGVGYTFPCLFHEASVFPKEEQSTSLSDVWLMVSETGVTGDYVGGRLSEYTPGKGYSIAFPQEGECNGWGDARAAIMLPGSTPWRTLTVGRSLAPIVETTIPYDVVEPLYEPKADYKPGRYVWSWLLWQDNSINYDDQKSFIDMAAQMGYEYILIDNWWDRQIGREGIEKLARYAKERGISLMLWFNSNGTANNAPQTPRGIMNRPILRKQAMAWMQSIGVKGIKVDFFGGDKQHVLQLYEDILSDANDYGIAVIFHGCTLPRGWERMYPNYIASEGCLASENVYFSDYHAKKEGFEMTMHPFGRNAVASFDWGGVMMNRHMSRDNQSRHQRFTTDVFELATAITNQCDINCVALTPNVVGTLSSTVTEFLKALPTTWEQTRFIAGYPTRYAVIARQHAGRWYIGGLNGTYKPITVTLQLPMLAGKTVTCLTDGKRTIKMKGNASLDNAVSHPDDIVSASQPDTRQTTLKVKADGTVRVTIQPMGGIVIME